MHILLLPSWYATEGNKVHGSFFKEQGEALNKYGIKVTVSFNEVWPITRLGRCDLLLDKVKYRKLA